MVLISACGPQSTPTPNPGPSQVWIISPPSGAILPLQPVVLTFEGASFYGITEFEIQVDGNFESTVVPSGSGSCGPNCGDKFWGEYSWSPLNYGTYTIAIRAFGNGQFSPSTEIEITIAKGELGQASSLEAEEITPVIPVIKPTPTPTLMIKSEKVFVIGLKNGNCRKGGGNQYAIVDTLMQDEVAEAVAMSEDGYYVKIVGPAWQVECWIWIELIDVKSGELKNLVLEPYPAVSEPQSGAPNRAPSPTPAGRP